MTNGPIFVLSKFFKRITILNQDDPKYCGVMKFLADMPSRLGGEDNGTNVT